MLEIKLLSEEFKNFRSGSKYVTIRGHACVSRASVVDCPKITNIIDLIEYVVLDD